MSSEARVPGQLDFQRVYGEFHHKIRRYLTRMVGPTEAEDATQDVFAKVSQALPEFRGDSSLSTWIYRIATNTVYDRLRSRSFQRSGQVPLESARPTPDPASGIDQQLVRSEMNACIDEYIARLPASYRAALVLSEHEGLTNQQIADALGVTVATVKIRLHRARVRLRRELGDGCSLYRDGRNELACEPRPKGVSPHD